MTRVESDMEWNGRRIWTGRGKARARVGLMRALELILAESNKIVPLDEATLERSGKVSVSEDDLKGAIYYDTPYAMRQHEELSWKHAPGRQAKFLETAMNANRAAAMQMMQDELKSWMRGG